MDVVSKHPTTQWQCGIGLCLLEKCEDDSKWFFVPVGANRRDQAEDGWSVHLLRSVHNPVLRRSCFFTTLAFWLRSSVVSVLYSLTTITTLWGLFVVILFLPARVAFLGLLKALRTMTLPLHSRLVSSGPPPSSLFCPSWTRRDQPIWQCVRRCDERLRSLSC